MGFIEEGSLRPLTSADNVAHAAALAAFRWHGYRSENRYTVFQCHHHMLGWSAFQWRILDNAHQKRNLAEYQGFLDPPSRNCARRSRIWLLTLVS